MIKMKEENCTVCFRCLGGFKMGSCQVGTSNKKLPWPRNYHQDLIVNGKEFGDSSYSLQRH